MAEPLTWVSSSHAEDLLMIALVDAMESLACTRSVADAAIIGGVMVELHVRIRSLAMRRTTKDVDVGIHRRTLVQSPLVAELKSRDYKLQQGHLLVKRFPNSPGESSIDLLVPAYTTRQSREREIGEIVTIEVGLLSEALRATTLTTVHLTTTTGREYRLDVRLPQPLAALALKLSAWDARRAEKDAIDVWRCLEIARHDGLRRADWPDWPQRATEIWRRDFSSTSSAGVVAAVKRLAGPEAEQRAARIVALGVDRVGNQ